MTAFSYSEMVRKIYYDQTIEDPVINGNFTDIERKSINELIEILQKASTTENESNTLSDEFTEIEK